MLLETLSQPLQLARATNYSTNGYPTIAPQNAVPAASAGAPTGVIDLSYKQGLPGQLSQNALKVVPFGVGADTTVFNVRVIGWSWLPYPNAPGPGSAAHDLWVPLNLLEVQCALDSSNPGVDGTLVPAADYFCDTITVVTGSTLGGEAAGENIVSPANDTIGHFLVDMRGCQKIQLIFTTGGTVTSCNALWGFI